MAIVTGSLKDIVGAAMGNRQVALVFRLNGPAVQANSTTPGMIHPTAEARVVPAANGSFTVDLIATTVLRGEAWYTLRIEWLDGSGPLNDFPEWKIRVPTSGGNIADILEAPANPMLFWIGEDPPPNPTPGQNWLKPSTGDISEWS